MSENETCGRESEIKSGLNRLEEQAHELLNALSELSKRLTTVLRPEEQPEKQPEVSATSLEIHTSMGQQIAAVHGVVRNQMKIVNSILNHLEV